MAQRGPGCRLIAKRRQSRALPVHKGICPYSPVRCQRRCQLFNNEPPVTQDDSAHLSKHSSKVVLRPEADIQCASLTGPTCGTPGPELAKMHSYHQTELWWPEFGAPFERGFRPRIRGKPL